MEMETFVHCGIQPISESMPANKKNGKVIARPAPAAQCFSKNISRVDVYLISVSLVNHLCLLGMLPLHPLHPLGMSRLRPLDILALRLLGMLHLQLCIMTVTVRLRLRTRVPLTVMILIAPSQLHARRRHQYPTPCQIGHQGLSLILSVTQTMLFLFTSWMTGQRMWIRGERPYTKRDPSMNQYHNHSLR